jgi:uncharacterized protein (TIGR04255 family)
MPLPKKLSPDNIRDAVVEIKYLSDMPFEVLVGIFYSVLGNEYTYTNRPLKPNIAIAQGQQIIGNPTQSLFYNRSISIQVLPNSFVFSCLNEYIGWEDFRQEIQKPLKLFASTGKVKKSTAIGLRYISEYIGKNLKECINFNFTFGLPDIQSLTTAFRTEFEHHGMKVILNLQNNIPVVKPTTSPNQYQIIHASLIDIDVINDKMGIENIDELMKEVDKNHAVEKEIFFAMLKKEFLKTLNPKY